MAGQTLRQPLRSIGRGRGGLGTRAQGTGLEGSGWGPGAQGPGGETAGSGGKHRPEAVSSSRGRAVEMLRARFKGPENSVIKQVML